MMYATLAKATCHQPLQFQTVCVDSRCREVGNVPRLHKSQGHPICFSVVGRHPNTTINNKWQPKDITRLNTPIRIPHLVPKIPTTNLVSPIA